MLRYQLYNCVAYLRELSPPEQDPREDPEVDDHHGGEEEPEELTEEAQVGPAGQDEAVGVEDEEDPPADGEVHHHEEDLLDCHPALNLQRTVEVNIGK